MQKTTIQPPVAKDHDPLIQETLQILGIKEIPTVLLNLNPDGHSKEVEVPLFSVENNNLQILMPNLHGRARSYKDKGIWHPVILTKVTNAVEDSEWKFDFKNSAFDVFIDYPITKKILTGKKIPKLVLVDDPITAMLLNGHDIDAIAIPGYPYQSLITIPAHILDTLMELCVKCGVENLTYIVPSDVVTIDFKPELDLYKKPKAVYNSIWNLFVQVCSKLHIHLYFAHFKPELTGRRISTVLQHGPGMDLQSIEDLKKEININFASPYYNWIVKHDLRNAKSAIVKEIFGIEDHAKSYYTRHCKVIMGDQFTFDRSIFQYDYDGEEATHVRSVESAQFVCIEGTYFTRGIDLEGRQVLNPFADNSFQKKFPNLHKQAIKKLKNEIPYYDGAESIPSHTNYIHDWTTIDKARGFNLKFFNIYKELSYKPVKGSLDLTMKFIKHIFGNKEIKYKGKTYISWQLGLDYCKLMYCNPMQKLPILCLVSHERQTAKTTFWDWLKEILGENSTHISEKDIDSQFTSLIAGKLLAVMEETYIEKIQTFERLKELVTAKFQKLERKGKDPFNISNFIKVGISSNKINNFASIDDAESRFWVLEVPPIPKSDYDVHFNSKLYKEIPAFLDYILEMPYYTEHETRAWFADELIKTDALDRVKAKSRSQNEILIERTILSYMKQFNLTWCKLSLKDIRELADERDLNFKAINIVLENKWNKTSSNRGNKYTFFEEIGSSISPEGFAINEISRKGFSYTFTISDFERNINLNELKLQQILDIIEHENNTNHPISKEWNENKKILEHPEVFKHVQNDHANIMNLFNESISLHAFVTEIIKLNMPF